jgi:EAL domain-containing protein (putative c-di-GMP-specific phosphodiesterase class I)
MTQRLELLKDALSNDRLVLFAQPIRPIGREEDELSYEILLRLKDPNGDYLPPGVFLPVAEAYGFMRQIDQWVIRRTLETLAANPEWLSRTRKCSINLAGVSLSTEDILTFIAETFEQTGVPPEKIGFEVTETQHIQSREVAERVTEGLRRLGCSVSLDDFGTGLATFDYLKSFQFDTLKIDGLFIRSITTSEEDRRIVKAMCYVARGMGLKTVAEFVENMDVMTLLQELGVDYGQGFGLGRPGPLGEMFSDVVLETVPSGYG